MAHTDKTDPFWVQTWTGALAHREVHDHTEGVCDLPATIVEYYDHTRRPRGSGCHWEFVYTGINTCGCWLCCGRSVKDRRRERRDDATQLRAVAREARVDWRSLDY